jgi:hypothetical protein
LNGMLTKILKWVIIKLFKIERKWVMYKHRTNSKTSYYHMYGKT